MSIIDLEALTTVEAMKSKTTPAPLATFALQEGCNYVSFASSGLRLLTVSRSGKSTHFIQAHYGPSVIVYGH